MRPGSSRPARKPTDCPRHGMRSKRAPPWQGDDFGTGRRRPLPITQIVLAVRPLRPCQHRRVGRDVKDQPRPGNWPRHLNTTTLANPSTIVCRYFARPCRRTASIPKQELRIARSASPSAVPTANKRWERQKRVTAAKCSPMVGDNYLGRPA